MLSRLVSSRSYSAAAGAARSSSFVAPTEEKVSRLPSGISVGSIDNAGPVSQFVIAYRAGSRFEGADEAGLVHHLRHAIGTDSRNYLGVKLLWQTGSIGGTLNSSATKDLLLVQINALRNHAPIALSLLGEFAQPALKPWDVIDNVTSFKNSLAATDPFDATVELLHRAAYRNGSLANSTIAPLYTAGKVSPKKLAKFAANRLVASETAIVGVNVDHSLLLQFANEQNVIPAGAGSSSIPASPYIGGDSREASGTPLAHVAIAGAGVGLNDARGVAVQAVLSAAIGAGPATKYSPHTGNGIVTGSVLKAANNNPVGIAPINISHSDAGLAGVYLVAEGSKIESYIRAAVEGLKQLASSGVSGDALEIAKKTAELNVLIRGENPTTLASDRAAQLLASGSAQTPVEIAQAIAQVSGDDVKKAASKLVSKLSVGAYGFTAHVPYADQL
uniref:Peptidase_M16 domain-containing protein n=1 Tax=Panagrellus redivivus TaxID=6233 RepID=A0A7E4VRK3_PANRE